MDSARFYNFCRLCLCTSGNLVDVFRRLQVGPALIEMIRDLLKMEVIKDDSLDGYQGWNICKSCISELIEFSSFKDRCMRSKLVWEAMFRLNADGPIVTASKSSKVVGEEIKTSEDSAYGNMDADFLQGLISNQKGARNLDESNSVTCPLGSILCTEEEEAEKVEFCWCSECGNEFLSHRELKSHSEWCRGRVKSELNFINGNLCGEEECVGYVSDFKQQLFDPNICCGRCRKVFKTKDRLIRHIDKYDFKCKPKNPGNLPIVAENSEDSFLDSQNLSLSQNSTCSTAHTNSVICSSKCGMVFESKHLLKQHQTNCNSAISNEGNEKTGLKSRGKGERNSIEVLSCNQEYEPMRGVKSSFILGESMLNSRGHETKNILLEASSISMEVGINNNEGIVFFCCDYCQMFCKTKSDLRSHIVKCHLSLNPQKCTVCHRWFTNSEELEEHSRLHPKDKNFYCTVCEESFSFRKILKKHIIEMHGSKESFICGLCFNGFTSKSDAGLHASLVHTNSEKQFRCAKCGKSFTGKHTYDLHVKVCQLKTVTFQCKICSKHFERKSNLHTHHLFHVREKKFCCHLCPKKFWQSSDRNIHIRGTHLKIRPYECGICSKGFVTKSKLKIHYRVHSDERPFSCPECPKSYKYEAVLKGHLCRAHQVS